MLVLSRKLGERVCLDAPGGRIEVVVVDVDRGKVRLGIVAPPAVKIVRAERLTAMLKASSKT